MIDSTIILQENHKENFINNNFLLMKILHIIMVTKN